MYQREKSGHPQVQRTDGALRWQVDGTLKLLQNADIRHRLRKRVN